MAVIRNACSSVTKYSNSCNRFSTDDKRWEIGPSLRHAYGHPGQQSTDNNSKCSASTNSIQWHNSINIKWENTKTLHPKQIFNLKNVAQFSTKRWLTYHTRAEIHWAPFQMSQHLQGLQVHNKTDSNRHHTPTWNILLAHINKNYYISDVNNTLLSYLTTF